MGKPTVPRTRQRVVGAVLLGLLLGGCVVRGADPRLDGRAERRMEPGPGDEKQRVERAALEYIERTKKWRLNQFRLEHDGWADDGRRAIVRAVFLEDERRGRAGYVGGGESVALFIDRQDYRVVRELHFQ